MSLLNINLADVPEQVIVPEGEYKLIITKATQKNSKAGNPMLEIFFNIIEEKDAKMVAHYITLPTGKNDVNFNNKRRRLVELYESLNFDLTGKIDTEDFKGKEVWTFLKEEEGDDQYGSSNRITRFISGK